jgi:hypothetical protein
MQITDLNPDKYSFSMNKVFPARALALFMLLVAIGQAIAAPPTIYLSCSVSGVNTLGDELDKLSEIVEVKVDEKPWLSISLHGEQISQIFSSKDIADGDLTSTAISNRSNSDQWDLTTKIVNTGTRTYTTSVKIDRVNGSFTYHIAGTTNSGLSFDTNVAGTCTKRNRARKF